MNNKKLIYVVLCMIVVMLCFSYSTMAWISMNRKVWSKNQTMTIQSVSNVTTVSCFALQYDGICGAVCYKIGPDSAHDEVNSVTMTEFDKIFLDRNVNTPLVFVLEIGNVPNESGDYLAIKVPCDEKYILPNGGQATNNYITSGERYSIQQYISNVLSIKMACSGNITLPTPTKTERIENNVTLFTQRLAAFESVTGDLAKTFASATTNAGVTTYSKVEYVELRLRQSDYSALLFDATDETGTSKHLILYIEFDYDDTLMDVFINHLHEGSDNTTFGDDVGTIQIFTGKEGS
ncbi:MAG: hypothetical protein K6F14_06955 [Clostridiales bacterium]|nr:hypothetical protein [Clostridiales bacterium]